jgi:DNA-binding transcriptional ArsR family regulator
MSSAEAAPAVVAALGDPTRLELVRRLRGAARRSIAELGEGLGMTRQAVAKHLRVLEAAGLVAGRRQGRETLFALQPDQLAQARVWIDEIAGQWDDALDRLKTHVEDEAD